MRARIRRTYGGDQVSTWLVLRLSCKPRSPVGLVKQPGQTQVRRTISQSLPDLNSLSARRSELGPWLRQAAPTNGLGAAGEPIAQSATAKGWLARRLVGCHRPPGETKAA